MLCSEVEYAVNWTDIDGTRNYVWSLVRYSTGVGKELWKIRMVVGETIFTQLLLPRQYSFFFFNFYTQFYEDVAVGRNNWRGLHTWLEFYVVKPRVNNDHFFLSAACLQVEYNLLHIYASKQIVEQNLIFQQTCMFWKLLHRDFLNC